jgi:hypothetical protein
MSRKSATSQAPIPGLNRASMSTSTTTEKYPASSSNEQQGYPEVVPIQSQHSLPSSQPYSQPNPAYVQQPQFQQPQYPYHDAYSPSTQRFVPQSEQPVQQLQKRNPWGLSPFAFGLLVAAITAVIVGGAVGGGLGGALASKDSDSAT